MREKSERLVFKEPEFVFEDRKLVRVLGDAEDRRPTKMAGGRLKHESFIIVVRHHPLDLTVAVQSLPFYRQQFATISKDNRLQTVTLQVNELGGERYRMQLFASRRPFSVEELSAPELGKATVVFERSPATGAWICASYHVAAFLERLSSFKGFESLPAIPNTSIRQASESLHPFRGADIAVEHFEVDSESRTDGRRHIRATTPFEIWAVVLDRAMENEGLGLKADNPQAHIFFDGTGEVTAVGRALTPIVAFQNSTIIAYAPFLMTGAPQRLLQSLRSSTLLTEAFRLLEDPLLRAFNAVTITIKRVKLDKFTPVPPSHKNAPTLQIQVISRSPEFNMEDEDFDLSIDVQMRAVRRTESSEPRRLSDWREQWPANVLHNFWWLLRRMEPRHFKAGPSYHEVDGIVRRISMEMGLDPKALHLSDLWNLLDAAIVGIQAGKYELTEGGD